MYNECIWCTMYNGNVLIRDWFVLINVNYVIPRAAKWEHTRKGCTCTCVGGTKSCWRQKVVCRLRNCRLKNSPSNTYLLYVYRDRIPFNDGSIPFDSMTELLYKCVWWDHITVIIELMMIMIINNNLILKLVMNSANKMQNSRYTLAHTTYYHQNKWKCN